MSGVPTERVEMSTAWFLTTERGREKREKKTGEGGGGGYMARGGKERRGREREETGGTWGDGRQKRRLRKLQLRHAPAIHVCGRV